MQTYEDRIERQARRRAGMKMGWFLHAAVYLAVNAMLATLSAMNDRSWAIYPALGWGLGLAIHGIVTFIVTGGGGLQERLVESERRKLLQTQDRW